MKRNGHHWRLSASVVAVAMLALTGCAAADTDAPPEVSSLDLTQLAAPLPPPPEQEPGSEPGMAVSPPVSVAVPVIGVGSELIELGLNEDGTVEVPPGDPGAPAGWYVHSPTPGERGPAVLLGHVNATDGGPGVFARIEDLVPGDRIEVPRADGTTAVFTVTGGQEYDKDEFPSEAVYGNTDGAELRLVTCDGYDPATGVFESNYVVYAKLAP